MGDNPPAFLTDERRAVLEGSYDGADNVRRSHQSRIRARSRTALDELIQVAESDEIDNADVFDPETIHHLLTAIIWGGGGLDPETPPEEYRNEMYVELNGIFRQFHEEGE